MKVLGIAAVAAATLFALLPAVDSVQAQGRGVADNAALVAHGQDVFNKTCATGYCHGVKGVAGGAPRLVARGFDDSYVSQVVRNGIEHTGMPSFATVLPPADLQAVVAYVDSLNGIAPPVNPFAAAGAAPQRQLSPDAQRGRAFFTDQVRGLIRCSVCHQVDGVGVAVALPFTSVPDSVAALRAVATPQVETATAYGDTFPAVVLNKSGEQTKLYDLSAPPPPLRTIPQTDIKFKDGSAWSHADMLKPYTDQELDAILAFLHAVVPVPAAAP